VTLRGNLDALHRAASEHRAIGAFTVYDTVAARAIVAAGEATGTPLILQAGSSGFAVTGERPLQALTLAIADEASISVGVHLDHSRDLDELRTALDAGYTSVMIDGSHLGFADNIALTRRAMQLVDDYDAWLEAELGAIGGDEDRSTDAATATMTDPLQAMAFVEETGVHALAVAVGNVHGFTAQPVHLDLNRLCEIHDSVTVPLVLHGASGLSPSDLARAIDLGIAKININAEIRRSYIEGLRDGLATCAPDDLIGTWSCVSKTITATASQLLDALDPTRREHISGE
jgi:tagatose 1,6-diphosphate aldolase GatY/KbaY